MTDLVTYPGENPADSLIRREDINYAMHIMHLQLQNAPKNAQTSMVFDQEVDIAREYSIGLTHKEAFWGVKCSGKRVSQRMVLTLTKLD